MAVLGETKSQFQRSREFTLNCTRVTTHTAAALSEEEDGDEPDGKNLEYIPDDDIWRRFLEGMSGNVAAARTRYLAMMQWRKEEDIDTILTRPHPYFQTVFYVHSVNIILL